MTEPPLIGNQREALRRLIAASADRARTEASLGTLYAGKTAQLEKLARAEREAIEARYAAERDAVEADRDRARADLPARAEAERREAQKAHAEAKRQIQDRARRELRAIDEQLDQARWEATSVFEAGSTAAAELKAKHDARLADEAQTLEALRYELELFLQQSRAPDLIAGTPADPAPAEPPPPAADPLAALRDANAGADAQLERYESLALPKLLRGGLPFFIFLLIGLATVIPGIWYLGTGPGGISGLVVTVVLASFVCWLLYREARRQLVAGYPPVARTLAVAASRLDQATRWSADEVQARRESLSAKHAQEVRLAERQAEASRIETEGWRDVELGQIDARLHQRVVQVESAAREALEKAEAGAATRLAAIEGRRDQELQAVEEADRRRREQFHEEYQRQWSALSGRWLEVLDAWGHGAEELIAADRRLFPPWDAPGSWEPPAAVAPALRFGRFEVDRSRLLGGLPRDPRLRGDAPERVTLPALLPFPGGGGSLVIRNGEGGRQAAAGVLQAVMLRLLTATPPGKVRFTIIDPVGLGQNFAAFMHLADYDEALVTSRIWTEPAHIEKKLGELTEHMEKVIQKYLRNEYGSIQEYNEVAGEVAEPFRVVVVANFPAGFNELAARRLASIAQSGPRCGVYLLLSLDECEPLPPGIAVADLERSSTVLSWRNGRFAWEDPDFGAFPLDLDAVPADDRLTALLHEIGAKAEDAGRVEVPFEVVAPAEASQWSGSTADGIDVPLGRVGATKLQYLRLGRGTSQHALLAGRTGSGKSTLLHALITNAALRYRPEELELYLIDFKKGVEFKTYAAHGLPHARVVAIESEREFGLSVLQRLDAELVARGEVFRAAGVQDVAGYREAVPDRPMPRILLVVDEFQEFFVDDDKLAQEAALLLDRLVRQGRAFGIHILLGSQTLGGAFSLARSTLGQMAVRIALQCSEADAHLILSEENGAARLLSRPGEAIYNDANGLIEGNHFFQVVWLGEQRRERYLDRIRTLESTHANGHTRPQIVFEGNVPAELATNPKLEAALAAPAPAAVPKSVVAWLGDAVAIKDPTAAVFRRQAGSHLLMIGQNDEAALAMTVGAVVGLAAQLPPDGGRFLILDGTTDDARHAGTLGRLGNVVPQPIAVLGWRDLAAALAEVGQVVERRVAGRAFDEPPLFVVVHDLTRFRDLRKGDDDYGGFSFDRRGDEAPSPSKVFATILKDGPGVGVHAVVWCDSLNNLNRSLDRGLLREFEQRVLFQMSPNDSSTLIDSPAAGKLGYHRALYASEEEGRLEKFRPFGLPDAAWWAEIRRRFEGRAPREAPGVPG
jgi:hypothetical protein